MNGRLTSSLRFLPNRSFYQHISAILLFEYRTNWIIADSPVSSLCNRNWVLDSFLGRMMVSGSKASRFTALERQHKFVALTWTTKWHLIDMMTSHTLQLALTKCALLITSNTVRSLSYQRKNSLECLRSESCATSRTAKTYSQETRAKGRWWKQGKSASAATFN